MGGDGDWDKGQGEGQGDRERDRGTVIGKGTNGQSDRYRNRRTGKRIGGQQQRQLCVEWGSTTTGWHIYVRYVRVKLQHNGIQGIHGLNGGHLCLKVVGHLCLKWVGQLWQSESFVFGTYASKILVIRGVPFLVSERGAETEGYQQRSGIGRQR